MTAICALSLHLQIWSASKCTHETFMGRISSRKWWTRSCVLCRERERPSLILIQRKLLLFILSSRQKIDLLSQTWKGKKGKLSCRKNVTFYLLHKTFFFPLGNEGDLICPFFGPQSPESASRRPSAVNNWVTFGRWARPPKVAPGGDLVWQRFQIACPSQKRGKKYPIFNVLFRIKKTFF